MSRSTVVLEKRENKGVNGKQNIEVWKYKRILVLKKIFFMKAVRRKSVAISSKAS